jgi:hypothetical protein
MNANSVGRKAGLELHRTPDATRTKEAVTEEVEDTTDDLWKSARQWRNIEPKERGVKHGQMLLSLEMNVPIVDSLAL